MIDARNDFGAAGDGLADDADALQAALDAVPKGGEVSIPPGRYRLSRGLVSRRQCVIRGGGLIESENTSPFGSKEYGDVWETGTVLECYAADGVALDHSVVAPLRLAHICIKGVGGKDRTTVGLRLGQKPDFPGPNRCKVSDVLVLNFAVGIEANCHFDSRFDCISAYGCQTGLLLNGNQCVYTQTDIKECDVGIALRGGNTQFFYGGAIQGCFQAGVTLDKLSEENYLSGIYFENKDMDGPAFAVAGDTNRLAWNHYGTPRDAVTITGNSNVVMGATKASQTLTITGQDNSVVGPWAGRIVDTGHRTCQLAGLTDIPSPGPLAFPGLGKLEVAPDRRLVWTDEPTGKTTVLVPRPPKGKGK